MEKNLISNLHSEVKVGFVLTVAEKVFAIKGKDDERYQEGREALDKCWLWVESHGITGDKLYELIDNADYTGISEFAEDEDDLNAAKLWSLLVDAVGYTSWEAYKKEKVEYLPQSLEAINNDSISNFIDSAIETTFLTDNEIKRMIAVLSEYSHLNKTTLANREDFFKLLRVCNEL